jgi:chitinase
VLRIFKPVLSLAAIVIAVASFLSLEACSQSIDGPRSATSPHAPVLVGYFPQWGLYSQPQYLVKDIATSKGTLLDQVNYAQGFVTGGHCSVADPNADLNYTFSANQSVDGTADVPTQPFRGYLHQLQELKRRSPHLRVLISLEGRASDFANDAQPKNREAFVRSCIATFLEGQFAAGIDEPGIFDGIDLDWEYPHQADAANYLALVKEFRRQMDALRPGFLLTVAVGPSPKMYQGTDMGEIGRLVDRVGLMTYDFSGPWSDTTGLIAPLTADASYDGGTVAHCIDSYLAAGVPAEKMLMGLPFYGYGWHQVTEASHGLSQEGLPIHGDRPYSYIAGLASRSTVYRDPASQTPWLFDGDIFWTYDDPVSIHRKAVYALDHQLGGLMIWELSEDTASADLLHAAYQSLHSTAASPLQSTGPAAVGTPTAFVVPGAMPLVTIPSR